MALENLKESSIQLDDVLIYYITGIQIQYIHVLNILTKEIYCKEVWRTDRMIDCVLINSQFFICGGYLEETQKIYSKSRGFCFDIENGFGKVNKFSKMPKPKSWNNLIKVGKLIYCVGGYNQEGVMSDCEKFDVKLDSWSVIPNINFTNCSTTLINIEDRFIYLFGGYLGEGKIEYIDT